MQKDAETASVSHTVQFSGQTVRSMMGMVSSDAIKPFSGTKAMAIELHRHREACNPRSSFNGSYHLKREPTNLVCDGLTKNGPHRFDHRGVALLGKD